MPAIVMLMLTMALIPKLPVQLALRPIKHAVNQLVYWAGPVLNLTRLKIPGIIMGCVLEGQTRFFAAGEIIHPVECKLAALPLNPPNASLLLPKAIVLAMAYGKQLLNIIMRMAVGPAVKQLLILLLTKNARPPLLLPRPLQQS